MKRAVLAVVLLLAAHAAHAEDLIMVRAPYSFPEAMNALQQSIQDHGYQLQRVQRVDVGLTSEGFKTAEYRVVFLGKAAEVEDLAQRYPRLMPYLPLKITLFAEGDTTLAVTDNPIILGGMFKDAALQPYFRRWEKDVRAILEQITK